LDDLGLPSAAAIRAATNRPHITLLAAGRIDPAVDDDLAGFATRFPLSCVIGAPLVFGAGRFTLTRMVVTSAELLALHADVYRRALPHVVDAPFAHSSPDQWVPHITVGRRFTAAQVGEALSLSDLTSEITARVVGLRRWDGDQRLEHLMVG